MENSDEPEVREVQCTFRTTLPDDFKVDESIEIQLNTNSTNKDLTQIIKEIIQEELDETSDSMKHLQTRKLQFMVNDVFVTTSL